MWEINIEIVHIIVINPKSEGIRLDGVCGAEIKPKATARIRLITVAAPKSSIFLDETPIEIEYIDAASIIDFSLNGFFNQRSIIMGERGKIMSCVFG